jgi:hypothetical protein
MSISFLSTALMLVSVLTNLTVEGIKKLLNEANAKYSSNALAAIISVITSCAICLIYLVMTDTSFTLKVGVEILILMYLGFLVSTVGYDKVIQTIRQIQISKEVNVNE